MRMIARSLLLSLTLTSCGYVYTPKPSVSRPPTATVADTPEARACQRTIIQTHEICRGRCRLPYTQYNVFDVEQRAQQCVTDCDDVRDADLNTCQQSGRAACGR
jgi:hypothetical protein